MLQLDRSGWSLKASCSMWDVLMPFHFGQLMSTTWPPRRELLYSEMLLMHEFVTGLLGNGLS